MDTKQCHDVGVFWRKGNDGVLKAYIRIPWCVLNSVLSSLFFPQVSDIFKCNLCFTNIKIYMPIIIYLFWLVNKIILKKPKSYSSKLTSIQEVNSSRAPRQQKPMKKTWENPPAPSYSFTTQWLYADYNNWSSNFI